ncbi:MAG: queuosine precursor transporter [Planctomycetes bacterium]|nr:queuosine precursor transporter [Planctomycetota bacterium]
MPRTRKELVFFILGGFFLTNAILGELTGGKLFAMPAVDWGWLKFGSVVLSIGVIPWPVVFITTDLVNEYYGRAGVRKLTWLTVAMIVYAFVVLFAAMQVPSAKESPVSAEVFRTVFGQSTWIIVGSLAAFLIAQLLDVVVFLSLKQWTGARMLWLRATGSTVFSQLVDTFVVGYIGFVVPGKLVFSDFLRLATGNYLYKVLIAVLITPVIYVVHGSIDRYLERDPLLPQTEPRPNAE